MLKAMSKFQGVLKMFMLGVLKAILKTMLKYKKTPSHFMARVEIERQISFFSFGFARVTEVRHIFRIESYGLGTEPIHCDTSCKCRCPCQFMYIN